MEKKILVSILVIWTAVGVGLIYCANFVIPGSNNSSLINVYYTVDKIFTYSIIPATIMVAILKKRINQKKKKKKGKSDNV